MNGAHGLQLGPIVIYWQKPIEVWWRNHRLISLPIGT